jgi:hypothetical protein
MFDKKKAALHYVAVSFASISLSYLSHIFVLRNFPPQTVSHIVIGLTILSGVTTFLVPLQYKLVSYAGYSNTRLPNVPTIFGWRKLIVFTAICCSIYWAINESTSFSNPIRFGFAVVLFVTMMIPWQVESVVKSSILLSENRAITIPLIAGSVTLGQAIMYVILSRYSVQEIFIIYIALAIPLVISVLFQGKKFGSIVVSISQLRVFIRGNYIYLAMWYLAVGDVLLAPFFMETFASQNYIAASASGKFLLVLLPAFINFKSYALTHSNSKRNLAKVVNEINLTVAGFALLVASLLYLVPEDFFASIVGDNFSNYRNMAIVQIVVSIPWCLLLLNFKVFFLHNIEVSTFQSLGKFSLLVLSMLFSALFLFVLLEDLVKVYFLIGVGLLFAQRLSDWRGRYE